MLTIILAKILGVYLLAMGIAFLINPTHFANIYQHIKKDDNFLFLGAIIALLIGAVIISLYNKWDLDWRIIITILGWWSLIKGFILLVYPSFIDAFDFSQKRSILFYRVISLFYVAIGGFLIYKSWF